MDFMDNFLEATRTNRIISIIGLAKNVSKTTTLNHIIKNLKGKCKLGLTSIGRDGEKYDAITELPKPKIYIEEGTYVATAEESYKNSAVKTKLIKVTDYNTPMGLISISKALNSGYIELAGPSINSQLLEICLELIKLGCDIVLIDGAFDRKSYATPLISHATILSTGASVSENMQEVIEITEHIAKLLTLEKETNKKIIELAKKILNFSKIGFINKDYSIKNLKILTALGASDDIKKNIEKDTHYIVINGPITDQLLEDLIKSDNHCADITFLVEDATKLFISKKTMEKFKKKGAKIKVLNSIKIIAITVNPTSPLGYEFNKIEFLKSLKSKIHIPIYDLGPCG